MTRRERWALAWALLRGRADVVTHLTRLDQVEGNAMLAAFERRDPDKPTFWTVLPQMAVLVPVKVEPPEASAETIVPIPVVQRGPEAVTVLRWVP